jgi:hypothetical protein
MGFRLASAILLLLVAAVFAASFGVGRAVRDDPEPASPPPAVVAPAPHLTELGPEAKLPPLRPAARRAPASSEEQ